MSVEFLEGLMIPVIVGICLCAGYLIKSWDKIPNKFIPTILALIGVVFALWVNSWNATPEIILSGIVSGLGSSGLYDSYKHIFGSENGRDTDEHLTEEGEE